MEEELLDWLDVSELLLELELDDVEEALLVSELELELVLDDWED